VPSSPRAFDPVARAMSLRPGFGRSSPEWKVYMTRRGQAELVETGHVILAMGAQERPAPFPGWTLPGVMTVGSAQILLKTSRQIPSEPVWVVGSGPLPLPLHGSIDPSWRQDRRVVGYVARWRLAPCVALDRCGHGQLQGPPQGVGLDARNSSRRSQALCAVSRLSAPWARIVCRRLNTSRPMARLCAYRLACFCPMKASCLRFT
jgi:hypothetical protein